MKYGDFMRLGKMLILCGMLALILLTGCGETKVPSEQFPEGNSASVMVDEAKNEEGAGGSDKTDALEKMEPESFEAGSLAAGKLAAGALAAEIPEEPASITLLMVGDILLHTPVEEAAKQEDGSYHFDAVFANLEQEIQAADVAIVNQEVIIGGESIGISGYPAFNGPFAVGDALVKAGFDVVCHGTNHALDKGKKGLVSCLDFWETNYPEIAVLGIHGSQEEQDTIYVYEQEGIRIAILNYTYGTNGIPLPEDMPYGVDFLEEEQVIADIAEAEKLADFTVVCPHWGTEYRLEPSAEQARWTDIFLENGVDLVLGTHPHVIEPVEWVIDEETGRKLLVYYSLGNFVNWTSGTGEGVANRMVGGMAQVTITESTEVLPAGAVKQDAESDGDVEPQVVKNGNKSGVGTNVAEIGEAYISDYHVEPVVCHLEEGVNGVTVYKLSDYTTDLAESNRIRQQDGNFSLEYCRQLCEQVWGSELTGSLQ